MTPDHDPGTKHMVSPIDRNPQKYVPNIFEAKASDYIKAEHRIYFSGNNATYIELPVGR